MLNGEFLCESVALNPLADQVGTPCYVYSSNRIRGNYQRVARAFEPLNVSIHYSLKANANLALIRILLAIGAGLDAVSGGEIYRALAAGADPARIVFAGVGKTRAELAYALDQHVGCFNVESAQELERLNTLAIERTMQATVALRLNPGVQAHTHQHIATGHAAAKFGMSADVVRGILSSVDRYPALDISGLHVHIGSQLESTAETEEAARHALRIIDDFPQVRRLNMGGGFPIAYTADDQYPPVEAFAEALIRLLSGRDLAIGLEPGRSIVADAGVLLVEVQYVKHSGGQRILVTDGGMSELIRPALYGAQHPVRPLRMTDSPQTESFAQVVGPICESADVLNPAVLLPAVQPGDRLAVLMVGAYGAAMGSTYNARPRPPEILVDGDQWTIIRRRETWEDLIRLER